jgi:hypothetical protein
MATTGESASSVADVAGASASTTGQEIDLAIDAGGDLLAIDGSGDPLIVSTAPFFVGRSAVEVL